jgi:serine phosphatase RsbU (regulator of sigma subunit)
LKTDLTDLKQRIETLAERMVEEARARAASAAPPPRAPGRHTALDEDYWKSLQDLFTRDVTGRGLRELLEQETRDTYLFFTREIDFQRLGETPWYKRIPLATWAVFQAMAYRLTPARRILFAVAVPLLFVGWARYVFYGSLGAWFANPGFALVLTSASLLLALLLLELRDKLGLKGDLEIARQIQFGLLPFEPYQRSGTSICAVMRPANTVGGDYFDLIELEGGRLAVVVGDVAGKGMPAALLMALLQGSLRTLLSAGLRGPDLVAKLNGHLYANIPSNRLVTLFYGELDHGSGELSYVNAGHNPPVVVRAGGGLERLAGNALALGIVAQTTFESARTVIGAGDRLLLYTDGITEAFNEREEEYGEERLCAFLDGRREASPRQLMDTMVDDVLGFCGPVKPRDDMTLLVLDRAR